MNELAEMTANKLAFLEDHAEKRREEDTNDVFLVDSIYECEFKEMLSNDPEARAFVQQLTKRMKAATPLQPKDAMRGGRTNAICRHYIPQGDEEIEYLDFR